MNPSKESICTAIGLAGAALLGGTTAILIMKYWKPKQKKCSLLPCDHTEEQTAETDTIQAPSTKEVNYDEN